LGTHPAIGGVGGRVRELHQDTPGDRFRGFFMKQDRGEQRLEGVELFGGCTLYPTELLRNVGGYFSPLRNSFEDFDICHRVQRAGKQTVYTPMAKGWHHKRDSITSALDTLFSWSYPHWEDGSWIFSYDWLKNVDAKEPPRFYYQELVSSSIARLSYKINSQLPANLARLEQEGITSELRLLAGVFVVRSIVKDLKIFQQLNTSCDSAVRNEVLTLAEDAIVAVLSSSGCSTFGREYVALIEDLLGGKGLRDFGGETLQSFLLRVKSRSLPEEAIDLLAVILEGLGQLPHRLQGVSASDLRAESSKR
ncbi:MAG: hypothetical protein EBZ48_11285, partial [Proteobacteria bacterium]|nr:hypothetical protein [Pseudomonadota bacterium]